MVDVFPVVFDFKKGEQPDNLKLTKWVKLTDGAFGLVVKAIGDPWDYQTHSGTITPTSVLDLSPQKLSQPTLARTVGPSEYMGPLGETVNGAAATVEVTLNVNGASSWFFGFPFVKAAGLVGPEMRSSTFSLLDPDSAISIDGDDGLTAYFTTRVEDPRALTKKGEYYVDCALGLIQTATPIDPSDALITSELIVTISELGYIGAGPPWSTHNVIPIWGDDYNTGVTIVENEAGPGFYTITLPDRPSSVLYSGELPRVGKPADFPSVKMSGSGEPIDDTIVVGGQQTTFTERPIIGTDYKLPYSIVNSFEAGDVFPSGVILLWQNSPGRFLPLCEFEYVSETSIKVACPVLDDVTTTPNTTNYRVIITGTSLAEHVSYLSAVVRDNQSQGLAFGATASFPSVTYAPPISHDRLRDRFSMTGAREATWANFVAAFESWQERFTFAESHVPTNPHPQYMHRAGWMAQDELGNSGNAMRGELVFTSRPDPHTGAGTAALALGGQLWNTWGVRFGGGPDDSYTADRQNSSLSWTGARYGTGNLWAGESFSASFADIDRHLTFTNPMLGAAPWNVTTLLPATITTEYMYGALAHVPIWGTPLYLSGRTQGTYEKAAKGAVLAFDLNGKYEMNYLKLTHADRALWNYAFGEVNIPVPNYSPLARQLPTLSKLETSPDVAHDWHTASTVLDVPRYGRWSSDQIREFRFRGVSDNEMTMVGHQSIAAAEFLDVDTSYPKIVEIDDIPIRCIHAATSLVIFNGNYLPHLYPGAPLLINDDSPSGSEGSYFVKWAFYLAGIPSLTLDITIAKLGSTVGTLVDQPSAGGTATCVGMEMMSKFVSPSMVGADFYNVYGNAIFFSEGGGGRSTSFTDRGSLWLDYGQELIPYIGDQTPSAIFYHPEDATTSPDGSYYAFTVSETGHAPPNLHSKQTRWPLLVGDNFGIWGHTSNRVSLQAQTDPIETTEKHAWLRLRADEGSAVLLAGGESSYYSSLTLKDGNATLLSTDNMVFDPIGTTTIGSDHCSDITIQKGYEGTNTGGIFLFSNEDVYIDLREGLPTNSFQIRVRPDATYYPFVYAGWKPDTIMIKQQILEGYENFLSMTPTQVYLKANSEMRIESTSGDLWITALQHDIEIEAEESVRIDAEEAVEIDGERIIFTFNPGTNKFKLPTTLPTSSSGLDPGEIWVQEDPLTGSGTLHIVLP
jgi:hypothetical protein